jgi:disulfide oxidoreductase YuzD
VSIGNEEYSTNLPTVAEVLPWLQNAIAEHYPDSKYNVERMGRVFVPTWVGPGEFRTQ